MSIKQRILVVDDTPSNIKIFNDLLKNKYGISVATNGTDALENATSKPIPDLILLDIMMPDMDGYEVCRQLKEIRRTKNIPVIFVTAKSEVEDESKGFEFGCVDYITKPVSPPIVLARIKTHIKLQQALETLESQNEELKAAARLREEVERITRHDLKNPLTGVFTGIDVLESMGNFDEDQIEILDIIKESSHKMLKMINSSLDLFKMEQKIYQPKLEDVDMIKIIQRIEKEMSGLIRLNQTSILVTLNDRPPCEGNIFNVSGETLLLYSMMANLIKNAIEATPNNEQIIISLSHEKKFGIVCIHNKGSVSKEIQDPFFEKYITEGKKMGTGIGTYSARLITETLGGKIKMTSSEEKGTFLFIHLPKGD
jgi:CheY-like chemotaxis protein